MATLTQQVPTKHLRWPIGEGIFYCSPVHTHAHTFILKCTHAHMCTRPHSHTPMHAHTCTHTHMHTCTHAPTFTLTFTHAHICTLTHSHMHTHTFTHSHASTRVHIQFTLEHACICTHIFHGNVSLYYTGDTLFCFSILFFYCGPHPIIKFTNPECRGWWGVFRTNFLRTNSLRYDLYGTKFTPLKFTTHFLVYFQNSQQSSNLL